MSQSSNTARTSCQTCLRRCLRLRQRRLFPASAAPQHLHLLHLLHLIPLIVSRPFQLAYLHHHECFVMPSVPSDLSGQYYLRPFESEDLQQLSTPLPNPVTSQTSPVHPPTPEMDLFLPNGRIDLCTTRRPLHAEGRRR